MPFGGHVKKVTQNCPCLVSIMTNNPPFEHESRVEPPLRPPWTPKSTNFNRISVFFCRLLAAVWVGLRRGRATVGAAAAAEALARTGGAGVRACVLAEEGREARGLAHLQLVLIEAFCREAGVPVARLQAPLPAPVLLLHDAPPWRRKIQGNFVF